MAATGKLIVCAVGGALVGGTTVHMLEKPPRPAAARKAPVRRPAVPVVPPPCELHIPPQLSEMGAGLPPLPMTYAPPQSIAAPSRQTAAEPLEVTEPASWGIVGLGVLVLAALRRRLR